VDWSLCLTRSGDGAELRAITLGYPLLDDYLAFVGARARPNTWLATAYDLKVFFTVVAKEPAQVTTADVFAFIKAQRSPRGDPKVVRLEDGESGLAARTIKRRLASVSGLLPIWWPAGMRVWPPIRCPEGWPPDAPRPDPTGVVSP
jgi:integrase/recombinase XerD